MALYNIYAGLGGGFGGETFVTQEEFDSYIEAEEFARQCAIEEYQSYEGYHGIVSEAEIRESYCEDNGIEEDDLRDGDYEDIELSYSEEIESWIVYSAVLASEDPNGDEVEEELCR